jgi:hypothetical protein
MAERTGCPVVLSLWSYVKAECSIQLYIISGINGLDLYEDAVGCKTWQQD